ncbi:60S ribosomal export protein NMD3-like [Littorina saxatilis]|uniref:60S ribosomal export protein NMD3-like n=1 Tax=Littorina saxatilis TaxID=31220 RepID=UPI0038B5E896
MEYVQVPADQKIGLIACCGCGTLIEPNPSNMCVACLRTTEDITQGIPKQSVLYFCRSCERYLVPPSTWVSAQLESRELLSVCLKKLKGLSKVRLVDAGFVWTEPHSMRVKVKLTIQKEVQGAVLQQVFVVEFTVQSHMCDECHRVEAKDFWKAVVQVRQKAEHKKTFFFLEQLILKHRAHTNTTNIKPQADGMDFYYAKQDDARKMVEFLMAATPCRYTQARELISQDIRNNTFNYKYTYSVEIIPICRDDIVCLPLKVAQQLGNINPLCLCSRVTSSIHLIDPATLQTAELSGTVYWRLPFLSLVGPRHMTEFMVMDVERVQDKDRRAHNVPISHKHTLVDVYVARMSDLGVNDQQFHTRSHLGHLLKAGDTVLGYDFTCSNFNHPHFEKLKEDRIPDVMLVRKVFDRTRRSRRRKWKLQRMADGLDTESVEKDYTEFLEDLEEDPEMRQHVNIYKDASKVSVEAEETDEEGAPTISLQEMLDDLHISHDATGGEGDAMME